MSIRFSGIKLIINVLLLSILIPFSNNALTQTFNVNAEYKPASYDDEYGANSFKNTESCSIIAYLCTVGDVYLFDLPITAYHTAYKTGNKRDEPLFIKIKPKKVTLRHKQSGDQREVTLIPTYVGMDLHNLNTPSLAAMFKNLGAVEGDCTSAGYKATGWTHRIRMIYQVTNEKMSSGCYVTFKYNSQYNRRLKIENVFLGFRLKSPNPLKMKNGDYTGKVDLLISPEGDIDLGNGSYSASHTFNFNLSVKHQIKVEFPNNSKKITLKPSDGWASGGKNTELSNDITYSLWASSNVKVSLRCQYKFNDACGIKNKKNHLVGLDVFNLYDGNKRTLLSEKTPQIIKVIKPKIGSKNKALFRVSNKSVTSMLTYPGTTYSGNVTIIYDASI